MKMGPTIALADGAAPALLQVTQLRFGYPERPLFDRWDAALPAGVTLVRGGDGAGKTSLLRLLAGQLPAESGRLRLDGIEFEQDPDAYRRQVFMVDPWTDAFDQMTPPEYFASLHAQYPAFDDAALPRLTAGLSLTPHLAKKLYMLSTGSKRKVYLAAAFASGAALCLLDDPFGALDNPSVQFVGALLNEASQDRTRSFVIALYETPAGIALAATLDLGD